MTFKSNLSFTLAEVLVTMLVIGIVAALTIPQLVQSIQDKDFKTAYKKMYSELNQAVRLMVVQKGGSYANIYDAVCSDNDCAANQFKNDLEGYMSFAKTCDNAMGLADGCWYDKYKFLGSSAGYFNSLGSTIYSSAIMSNGTLVLIRFRLDGTGYFVFDINGFKQPNTAGRDVFYINIEPDGTVRPVADAGNSVCDPDNPTTYGYGCSEKFLYE